MERRKFLTALTLPRFREHFDDHVEERHKHRAFYGNSYEIQVPCRLVWAEAPPGPLVAWPGNGLACAIGKPRRTSAGRRILLTPLAVLGDGVLLPLELLTIWSWW